MIVEACSTLPYDIMNLAMWLLIFCLGSVQICWATASSNCLEKLYPIALLMLINMPDWTYCICYRTLGYFPRVCIFCVKMFNHLAKSHFNQSMSSCYHINKMKREHMKNASEMPNMAHSCHSFFLWWWYWSNCINFLNKNLASFYALS